jgi:transposase
MRPVLCGDAGRPSLTPGTYFRLLLIGYFEGIDSEQGIAWRTADSLALRGFLELSLDQINLRVREMVECSGGT